MIQSDTHLISRLRDDADLRYLCEEPSTGKIIISDIGTDYFRFISSDEEETVYAAMAYPKALKRNIMLVHVTYLKASGKDACKLYFSTDVELYPADVLLYYHSCFQIEFLYRDGKQHTGLNDSLARSEKQLPFHFNASLTSINIAKAIHWFTTVSKTIGDEELFLLFHQFIMNIRKNPVSNRF